MYSSPTALYLSNAHIYLKRYYREDRSEGCLYILILLYTTLYTLLLFADTPSIALSKLSTQFFYRPHLYLQVLIDFYIHFAFFLQYPRISLLASNTAEKIFYAGSFVENSNCSKLTQQKKVFRFFVSIADDYLYRI